MVYSECQFVGIRAQFQFYFKQKLKLSAQELAVGLNKLRNYAHNFTLSVDESKAWGVPTFSMDCQMRRCGGSRWTTTKIKITSSPKKKGTDYFTKNFQVKENKTKMRIIYPRFFHLLF